MHAHAKKSTHERGVALAKLQRYPFSSSITRKSVPILLRVVFVAHAKKHTRTVVCKHPRNTHMLVHLHSQHFATKRNKQYRKRGRGGSHFLMPETQKGVIAALPLTSGVLLRVKAELVRLILHRYIIICVNFFFKNFFQQHCVASA